MAEHGRSDRIQPFVLNSYDKEIDGKKIPREWFNAANANPPVLVGRIIIAEVIPDDSLPTCVEGVAIPVIGETSQGFVAAGRMICAAVKRDARRRGDLQLEHSAVFIGAAPNVGYVVPATRVPDGLTPIGEDATEEAA